MLICGNVNMSLLWRLGHELQRFIFVMWKHNELLGRSSLKKMKVCILSKGGGGGQTPNPNFLDFILVELLNLVTEKFHPIFGPNFKGGCLKNFGRNSYFHFF